MSSDQRTLEELRREIDRIDDAMHDLLMERTAVVEAVGPAKLRAGGADAGGNQFFRPGREALILRRLLARHEGRFPAQSVVRIWREIVVGQLRLQHEFSVAVYTGGGRHDYWDLARFQYGFLPPLIACHSPEQVVRTVRDGTAAIGVLPVPEGHGSEPWWPLLVAMDKNTPRVVSRLPFAQSGRGRDLEALVIACLEPESTGADRALMAVEASEPISHSALERDLAAGGLPSRQVAPWTPRDRTWLCLVETAGMVTADDSRLNAMIEDAGPPLQRLWPLGGFAEPLNLGELSGQRKD